MEDQMVPLDLPGGLLQITAHGLGDVLQHLVHLGAARLGVAQGASTSWPVMRVESRYPPRVRKPPVRP